MEGYGHYDITGGAVGPPVIDQELRQGLGRSREALVFELVNSLPHHSFKTKGGAYAIDGQRPLVAGRAVRALACGWPHVGHRTPCNWGREARQGAHNRSPSRWHPKHHLWNRKSRATSLSRSNGESRFTLLPPGMEVLLANGLRTSWGKAVYRARAVCNAPLIIGSFK